MTQTLPYVQTNQSQPSFEQGESDVVSFLFSPLPLSSLIPFSSFIIRTSEADTLQQTYASG